MSTNIPLSLLRDLKCRHCHHFLSCGPVYVTPDCGLLCGRCRALAKPNFRNYVYEELASTFSFPCFNWEKNCPEEGPWNTLKEHEVDCPYKGKCGLMCVDPSAFFSSSRVLPNEENLLYLEVPDKCLNLVCCKNCGKYLSCEPVHINVVGSNICHRCYLSNGIPPHTLRNLAYEKLANIFRFPCIFRAKGCPIKFRFGRDSWEHEVGCRYRDVQIPSTPSTPDLDKEYLKLPRGLDNSGYRPSFEGCSLASRSFNRERPSFELPRVSSILRSQDIVREIRSNQRRKEEEAEMNSQPSITQQISSHQGPFLDENSRHFVRNNYEAGEPSGKQSDKDRIIDKEKGIVPTHTGHVYATLTKNTVLFAPPQIQPNKDPTTGIKVTKEFQDKLRRNASNASRNESLRLKKFRNSFSYHEQYSYDTDSLESARSKIISAPSTAAPEDAYLFDFPALNKHQMRDFENLNGEYYAPVVKEYVQHNPQNNVQRNDSMTIGNADLIAELKMRNEQRKKKRQVDENFNSVDVP